ncbi:hypothetical protein D3C80_1658600 [compost metagenome]
MMFATHPASCSPSRAIASALSNAWLMHPSRTPTTRITGNLRAMARSDRFACPDNGTRQPPAPSIKVKSAFCCSTMRIAASNSGTANVTPASRAATCGAMAGSKANGLTCS